MECCAKCKRSHEITTNACPDFQDIVYECVPIEIYDAEQAKVKKLEGWLRYLWSGGYPIDDIDAEIDSYIKELEGA